jgi:hypothetical protein
MYHRSNVDPTNVASDADIWQALTQAYLKEHVMSSMGGTLDAEISEGGGSEFGSRSCRKPLLLMSCRLVIGPETARLLCESPFAQDQDSRPG